MIRSLCRVLGNKYLNLVLITSLTLLIFSIFISIHSYSLSMSSSEYVITKALGVYVTPPWSTIDEGIKECIISAIDEAERSGEAVIIFIDSYGGYLDAAYGIADRIASAKVPVIAFISGGKALSAASLISLPAHLIAISPYAVMGAMQPVAYDPLSGSYRLVNESKIVNPIVEKAVSYAKLRHRNTTAAELFVRKNLVLNAEKAIKYHVADLIASNVDELLSKIKGMNLSIYGKTYILKISTVTSYSCSIRSRLISTFSNPLINSILMTIGVLGTIFAILSGKLPIIPLTLLFLLLGLLGTGFSPNLISLFMILLGAVLLAIELFVTPGFGVLGITGIIFLAIGFALLPSTPSGFSPPPGYVEQFRIVAVSIASGLGAFTGFIVYKVVKAKKRRPEHFVITGKVGRAIDDIKPGSEGFVIINGEYWRAISNEFIEKGSTVVVIGMDGARLVVKKRE